MRPIEKVLSHFEGVKAAGPGKWIVTCSAHDDRNPSLSIGVGDDEKVLLKCQAGCPTEEVLAKAGLTMADLFAEKDGSSKAPTRTREIVATHPYVDERGELLYEVVRYEPKDFRQRCPDGNGGYSWKLGDTRRVLFRLPDVDAAAKAKGKVAVVEGEKDVHALEAAGVVATCNPGGAGKWKSDYSESLRGARVAVIADRDAPGRKHAAEVAASLDGIASSVKILEPTVGKDISDHLKAGKTLKELVDVTTTTADVAEPVTEKVIPGRRIVARKFSAIEPVKTEWAWEGRAPLGTVTLIVGRQGLGKSTLLARLAAEFSRGRLPGDLRGTPATSMLVSYEESAESGVAPRLIAAEADLDRVITLDVQEDGRPDLLSLPSDGELIAGIAREHKAKILMIDPLMAALPSGVDSHRDQDVRRALAPLAQLAEEAGIAIIGVLHLRKGSSSEALDRVSGSVAFTAAARSVLAFGREDEDEDSPRRVIAHAKSNLGRLAPSLAASIESATVSHGGLQIPTSRLMLEEEIDVRAGELLTTPVGEDRTEVEIAAEWLMDHLGDGEWQEVGPIREQAKADGIAARTLQRAMSKIGAEAERQGFPGKGHWRLADSRANPFGATADGAGGATGANGSGEPNSGPPGLQSRQGAVLGATEVIGADQHNDEETVAQLAEAERIAQRFGLEESS